MQTTFNLILAVVHTQQLMNNSTMNIKLAELQYLTDIMLM